MGMGHVPKDPIHSEGSRAQFQGRERRGTSVRRDPRAAEPLAAARLARANWAEDLAADWYRRSGYGIIARNWAIRGGELDVVARRGSLVVVCEVKARADDRFGTPAEGLTETKRMRVRRTGHEFIRSLGERGLRLRFDLACVLGTELEVWEDAF